MYLKGVYKGSDVIGLADAPYAKDQCKEQGFINYSKQVAAEGRQAGRVRQVGRASG